MRLNEPRSLLFYCLFLFLALLVALTMSCQLMTLLTYKPPCGRSVLALAERNFEIKKVKASSSALPKIPQNTPDIVYWIDGTTSNHVFLLSPTTENLLLGYVLKGGEQVRVAWEDCNSAFFTLEAPQQKVLNVPALLDQSVSGITIVIRSDPTSMAWVIRGGLTSEEIQMVSTPKPEGVLAEISLLEMALSQDGTLLQLNISIANYGQRRITVDADNILLLTPDGTIARAVSSEPVLPREIAPGATETFSLTFARPTIPGATLKIFDAEYLLEGY